MNPLIRLQKTTLIFLVAPACFGFSPMVQALLPPPPPDGGYPNENTAEGDGALFSVTGGAWNTALGFGALTSNTRGDFNTATGDRALTSNTTGFENTATGASALLSNTTGFWNTATGLQALSSNTTGNLNTATGFLALNYNTIGENNTATGGAALFNSTNGDNNTATGVDALQNNTTGNNNTATGLLALNFNQTGDNNVATGVLALFNNTTGNGNTADGFSALFNNISGNNNITLGFNAGFNLTTGSNNIDIGNDGVAGESNTIRIGTPGTQTKTFIAGISDAAIGGMEVRVNQKGRLGTVPSSKRFKEGIKPMDRASEAILALKPVTFRYKKEIDAANISQFGLVAEEVEKVNPDLVVRDKEGKAYSVRYDQVNAMLLNEFLKEHQKTEKLEASVASLIATVKEQAAQIQKVSAQLEASKRAPQVVLNN
jgi:Chaperone of endosialidase